MMTALRSWPTWSKQLFQAEPAAGGRVVVLSLADWWTHSIRRQTADLERTSRFRRWHRLSKHLFCGVVSGVWRFFFFVRATIVASLDGKQDVQCSKVHFLAAREELNRRHTTYKGPERLLRTSAVSDLDVPTTYHKCVS